MKPKLSWWIVIGAPFIVRMVIFMIGMALSDDIILIASDVIFFGLLITFIVIRVRQNTAASRGAGKVVSESERIINDNDEWEPRRD